MQKTDVGETLCGSIIAVITIDKKERISSQHRNALLNLTNGWNNSLHMSLVYFQYISTVQHLDDACEQVFHFLKMK